MAFIPITSFEILAQPLAPVPNVPFVQQGSFLQITNLGTATTTVQTNYVGDPAFVATSGVITLFTNYITQTGAASATSYPVSSFLEAPIGFGGIEIPAQATFLFGVQYLLNPGATPPTTGIDARGYIGLSATAGSKLLVVPTVRQVFTNFTASGGILDLSEAAYTTPVAGGPILQF
jgi:hypothetical protein